MSTVIQINETASTAFPKTPSPLSAAAAAIDPTVIWQRIESYIVWRWTSRAVNWVVEGPGEFHPTLAPATIATVEAWSRGANVWETAPLDASPLGGYFLPCTGPYRFTGTVGGGTVPAAVNLAFIRLAEYFAAKTGTAGASMEQTIVFGVLRTETIRSESWMALALQNSGAADLLRQYRKV
jgi:hypothetical protein